MLLKVSGNVKYIPIVKYTSYHSDIIQYVFEIKTGSSTDVGKTVYKYSFLFSIVTLETNTQCVTVGILTFLVLVAINVIYLQHFYLPYAVALYRLLGK